LGRILAYAAPHRLKLALSVVLVVAITLLELCIPYITKEIIDRHIIPRDRISREPRRCRPRRAAVVSALILS
jgi:ATP-binding cassette, subfamily B, multidrug efflux pump